MNAVAPDSAVRTELLIPESAEALAGLLRTDPPERVLPPLWHWVYLLERPRQDELGEDGHARRSVESSPEPGLQRMFAGGRIFIHRELRLGQVATRTTKVASTETKQGRSGPLTFVTTRSTIKQDGDVAVVDERDIVYRPVAPPAERASRRARENTPVIADATSTVSLGIDPVLLFRFSALTYNAHRIHYDRDYARSEGHPDLVVHGPLQAILMAEALRRAHISFVGREFGFRVVAPCWGAGRIVASARADLAQVRDASNVVTATATLGPIG